MASSIPRWTSFSFWISGSRSQIPCILSECLKAGSLVLGVCFSCWQKLFNYQYCIMCALYHLCRTNWEQIESLDILFSILNFSHWQYFSTLDAYYCLLTMRCSIALLVIQHKIGQMSWCSTKSTETSRTSLRVTLRVNWDWMRIFFILRSFWPCQVPRAFMWPY